MSISWPHIPLGEVLSKNEQWVTLEPTTEYREVTVRLWGRGVVLRAITSGSEIAAASRVQVRSGQFILSRIDARNGAAGIVPPELDGAVVSGDFPAFDINTTRMLPEFLGWFAKTKTFVDMCRHASEGTTNRVRLKEEQFLNQPIPLPPIRQQRDIVEQLELFAALANEASRIRSLALTSVPSVLGSAVACCFARWRNEGTDEHPLRDFIEHAQYGTSEKTSDDAVGLPILRMGNINGGVLTFSSLKYLALGPDQRQSLCLRHGDIVVNRTNSAELVGKCAVFEAEGEYGFASYLIRLRLDAARARPWLVAAYINSPEGRRHIVRHTKQMTGQANVNLKTLGSLPLALPSLEQQLAAESNLRTLSAKIAECESLCKRQAEVIAATVPSALGYLFNASSGLCTS